MRVYDGKQRCRPHAPPRGIAAMIIAYLVRASGPTAAARHQPMNHTSTSSTKKTQICTTQLGRAKSTGVEATCWLSGVANSTSC